VKPAVFGKNAIFGESVRGASHKRAPGDKECQDSHICTRGETGAGNCYILAIADGHGSDACPYSKNGSMVAVSVFAKLMRECCANYSGNIDSMQTFLNREGETKIARAIDTEWKRRVLKTHAERKRDASLEDAAIYRQYGSTLAGLLVAPGFIFAFQIGDGNIVFLNDSGLAQVTPADKQLGVETHSLSGGDAWKKAVSVTKRRDICEGAPYVFMLTTDGFANSFTSAEEYEKSCLEYFAMIKEHGALEVAANLKKWLEETSEMGCGDDITALFFTAEDMPKPMD
jgi:serine/threonine protein phosphatase PrpC